MSTQGINMKVFISWSGDRSLAVAELLCDWIKCVLQATRPWLSSRDIDRGSLWFGEINDQLKDTTIGILCITKENKERPWILFEAGAIAKGITTNRVCTFLVDLEPTDLRAPLAQFNHTLPVKESVWNLIRTLNRALSSDGLEPQLLDKVFNTYWPSFESDFRELLEEHPETEKSVPRDDNDILTEILANTRSLHRRMSLIEVQVTTELAERYSERPSQAINKRSGVPTHVTTTTTTTRDPFRLPAFLDEASRTIGDVVESGYFDAKEREDRKMGGMS